MKDTTTDYLVNYLVPTLVCVCMFAMGAVMGWHTKAKEANTVEVAMVVNGGICASTQSPEGCDRGWTRYTFSVCVKDH